MAISDLVVLLPALREPTATVTDQGGRRVSWFVSGAFAMARDRLGLDPPTFVEPPRGN